MKKVITLLMALAFCLSMGVQSYAAQNTMSSALSKQLDQYNFSNEANDKGAQVKKWLDVNYPNADESNMLFWLYSGHILEDSNNDHMKLVTSRSVAESWTPVGKTDAQLGQCYESKVDLLVGELNWYASRVTTKVWVKAVNQANTITKVSYELSSRSAEDKDTNFRILHNDEINNNGYFYLYDYIGEASLYQTAKLESDKGVTITPKEYYGFFSDSDYFGGVDDAYYQDENSVVLADVTTDKDYRFDFDGHVYGLERDGDFDIILVDKSTGEEAEYDDGYLIESGKQYEIVFYGYGKAMKEFRETLFFYLNFSVSE